MLILLNIKQRLQSVADNNSQAWVVGFNYGDTYYYYKSYNRYVRCVRGRQ
jgi:hypothetical protein